MDYSRQMNLVNLENFPPVHIVGCGGIGSWLSLFLSLAGAHSLHLYDSDRVESSNLPRTPFRPSDVGKQKSFALFSLLSEYRPGKDFTWHGNFGEHLIEEISSGDLVAGCLDGISQRRFLRGVSLERGALYYDAGAASLGYNLSSHPAEFQISPPLERGYYTPIFISPVAMAAAHLSGIILRREPPKEIRFEF